MVTAHAADRGLRIARQERGVDQLAQQRRDVVAPVLGADARGLGVDVGGAVEVPAQALPERRMAARIVLAQQLGGQVRAIGGRSRARAIDCRRQQGVEPVARR